MPAHDQGEGFMADKKKSARTSPARRGAGKRRRAGKATAPEVRTGPGTFQAISLEAGDDAPVPLGANGARTLVFVHGIGNKPRESVLKCQWDTALFGHPMGDRTRLAYWVSRDYYPTPEDATCATPDHVRVDDDEISTHAIMALARGESGDEEQAIAREIEALASSEEEAQRLDRIARKMLAHTEHVPSGPSVAGRVEGKVIPFEPLRRILAPKLTRAFLRDVYDFLYRPERRAIMEQSLFDRLAPGGGPFVVVGHSQGSIIAYDVLRQLDPGRFEVPLFLTIGSPLGLDEVQDVLKDLGGGRLEVPACVRRWVNVADPRDIVAIDRRLDGEFTGGTVEDIRGNNLDSPDHPHSGTGYLRMSEVRMAVRESVGTALGQRITPFVLAGDLVRDLEDEGPHRRHPVLIQLAADRPDAREVARDLDEVAGRITERIRAMLREQEVPEEEAGIDRLRRYLSADLTRLELETLRSHFRGLKIEGIWRNAPKRAFITDSTHTVQARPANLGYGADGERIGWAVLDTGIRADHPHFGDHRNIVAQWDCTRNGAPVRLEGQDPASQALDDNGHGTHVAGIIAGSHQATDGEGRKLLLAGMAPRCQLYGFKVLRADGSGQDGYIIKALDQIAEINERAGQLVIHGVNLSLGGNFDPSVFGCGHTPLCQELRRLWRQGVLVCLAAGNEGFTMLRADTGLIQANMDISIGDPANLDEAIAVGSVHKTNPRTYGISFFSSRGPTADGRRKPDLVAPGERIISARHDWAPANGSDSSELERLYLEMSGTSMATPHVSGILAAFLSLRREFIGYPDRVKHILLESCIDLERDPYMQGAGLPNLIQMLALH
jgi:subtilisin family serine protease